MRQGSKGIFITGTDTGVGKTYVAAGLIRALKGSGKTVCPMKPVETGCSIRKGGLIPADALELVEAAGVHEPLDVINPYRFRKPLAPAVAAETEGAVIRKYRILAACRRLSLKYDVMIVEGAGGIMAPVYKKYLFRDLARDLGLPVLIVSRPGLGTINHTLLTVEAARKSGADVIGIILNHNSRSAKDASSETNPRVIERLSGSTILGIIPFMKNPHKEIFRTIAEKILRRL